METHECVPTSTKVCKVCKAEKPITDFYKGYAKCKCCYSETYKAASRAYYYANREKVLERCAKRRDSKKEEIRRYMAKYYLENRDKVLERCNEYRKNESVRERETQRQRDYYAARANEIQKKRKAILDSNPELREQRRAWFRQHYQENAEVYTEKTARRRRKLENATPIWADLQKIRWFYKESTRITDETGIRHHVDHIIPIQGRNVCGLHVEQNLRIIPAKENLSKSNKLLVG